MLIILRDEDIGQQWMVSTVYGSMENLRSKDFWDELNATRDRWNGAWCLGGDWNVVRFLSERLGCTQFAADMIEFSEWIESLSLVDLHLSGNSFTWSNHQKRTIMFRLDRFLVSTDWLDLLRRSNN